ncbi:MAG: 2Fe-2S iron-sulfur cluster-binding protein [Sphingobium limneticum]
MCGRCKVPLRQGQVTMEVEDALAADEKADGIILACQAKSVGDLVVDA